jgi:CRP-like cAMP-binding protein
VARSRPELDGLASVPLFRDLSRRELSKVAAVAKDMTFAEGSTITGEGDSDARFYLILDGEARVTVRGKEIARLGAGDHFGEMALLDGEPRSATVVAETDLRTVTLARWNFKGVVAEHPSIAAKLMAELSRRIRQLERSQIL